MSFTEYFETIKGMAAEGAQIAAKKTMQIASVTKANLAIRNEEEKIKRAQIELGKLYYKDYIVGEEPDAAEYTPWCEKISEAKIVIEDLRISIEDLKANGKDVEEDEDFVVEIVENEPCGCGCDHDHEDGCCCGEDHDHEDGCCCGEDHDHEDGCCCGEDHNHEGGCCCGHDHAEDEHKA